MHISYNSYSLIYIKLHQFRFQATVLFTDEITCTLFNDDVIYLVIYLRFQYSSLYLNVFFIFFAIETVHFWITQRAVT